uniref:Uncharacterized protein n=1 Tax=Anopheles albimanus TaxID=7167 RepID=A0A182FKI2_ANOAL
MVKRLTFALLWWNVLWLGEAGEWWHSSEERAPREALTRHRKSPFDVPQLKGFLIPGGASGEAGSVDRKVNMGVRTQCAKCSFQFDPKGSVYAMRCEDCLPVAPDAEQNRLVQSIKSDWVEAKQEPEQSRTSVMSNTPKVVTSSSSRSNSRPRTTHNPDKPPLKSDFTSASLDAKGSTMPKDTKSWPDALIELMVKKIELAELRWKHKPLLSALKSIFVATGSVLSKAFVDSQKHQVTPTPPISSTTMSTTSTVVPRVPRNRNRCHCRNRDRDRSVYPKKPRMNRCKHRRRERCQA